MTVRYAVTHAGGECGHVHTALAAAQRCARKHRDAAVHEVDEMGAYAYIAPPPPKRRGRPRLRPDATAVQVTVTMSSDLVSQLDAVSGGRTRSERFRIVAERGLAHIACANVVVDDDDAGAAGDVAGDSVPTGSTGTETRT